MPKLNTKSSINIENAAAAIAATVRKGKKVNVGEIMRNVGYSESTSKHPEKILKSKTYKRVAKPLIEGLAAEIDRVKEAMNKKDLNLEEYKVLNYALDNLVRNYQLLSGGATERQVFVLPSELVERNQIQASTPQMLGDGSTQG